MLCVYMSMDAQICRYMCINVYDERWSRVSFISAPPLCFLRPSLSWKLEFLISAGLDLPGDSSVLPPRAGIVDRLPFQLGFVWVLQA